MILYQFRALTLCDAILGKELKLVRIKEAEGQLSKVNKHSTSQESKYLCKGGCYKKNTLT